MAEQSLESIKQWLIDILTPPKRRTEDINLDEEYEFEFPQILTEPETFGTGIPVSESAPLDAIPEIVGEQVPADQSIPQYKWQGATSSDSDIEGQFQHLMPQPGDQAAENWANMAAADTSGMGQALFGGAQSAEQDASQWQSAKPSDEDLSFLKQKLLTMLDDNKKLEEFWKYLPK